MAESKLSQLAESTLLSQITQLVQDSPNSRLANAILFQMQYNSPGWMMSEGGLTHSLKVEQEEIDAILPFLGESGLVRLSQMSQDSITGKWEVWRVDEVIKYLQSDLPYGPHELIKKEGLSDEQILRAMSAVTDSVNFSYCKRVSLPLNKLRAIRDKTHEAINIIRQKEEARIYEQCNINQNWTRLPSFVHDWDDTRSDGYDINHFTFCGRFPSPAAALEEDFDNANADSPIDNEEIRCRINVIHINRRGKKANELILYNPRYYACCQSLVYQEELAELSSIIQGKLEKALSTA